MHDGPHVLLGRLYSIKFWNQWQRIVTKNETTLQDLINYFLPNKNYLVISTHYNDEFYFRLKMMQNGYIPFVMSNYYPRCYGASVFKKDNSTIFHIRTEVQYLLSPISWNKNFALHVSEAFKCPVIKSISDVFLTTFGGRVDYQLFGYSWKQQKPTSEKFLINRFYFLKTDEKEDKERVEYGLLQFHKYTAEELIQLQSKTELELNQLRNTTANPYLYTLNNYLKTYRSFERAPPEIKLRKQP